MRAFKAEASRISASLKRLCRIIDLWLVMLILCSCATEPSSPIELDTNHKTAATLPPLQPEDSVEQMPAEKKQGESRSAVVAEEHTELAKDTLEGQPASEELPSILEGSGIAEEIIPEKKETRDVSNLQKAIVEIAQVVQKGKPKEEPESRSSPAPVEEPVEEPVKEPVKEPEEKTKKEDVAKAQKQEIKARPPRPGGKTAFYTFFHKIATDYVRFLKKGFMDLLEKGHVVLVTGKPQTVLFLGDDAIINLLNNLAEQFDNLELKLERITIHPKYVDVNILMESLTMAGLANVWRRVEQTITTQKQQEKIKILGVHKQNVYARNGLAMGETAPLPVPPKIPYVFKMPWSEPFEVPRQSTGRAPTDNQYTIDFRNTASTERRGVMVVVGTAADGKRIREFVDSVDQPARQIMIEVQLVELNADAFSDLGIDSIQTGVGHNILNFAGALPGEAIKQPGLGEDLRPPGENVPPVVSEGLTYLFDDTSFDLSGRFISRIHALVRKGDATIKARPKILTLDDRPSILHIGDEVPSFESTGLTRDVTGGNFVSEINRVITQYVGFTLNIRPRISGKNADEIALQLEVVANQLRGRERVFEEDLAGIPIVARRRYFGQPRVKNHRPIILGGLIQEEEIETSAKVPFLGEIPVLGPLFSRTQKENRRTEIILVVTPHILSDKGVDRVATPKESMHFDTFDSVLFNDRHIIKGGDVWGIDPISKQPAMVKGNVFTEDEVIELTLLNIVKQRQLISKLDILEEYIPDEAAKLSWLQRKYPERSVYYWSEHKKEIYFKAAAIVIENIKELNHPLTYEDVVMPRREIILPTTPYRMTLSYDKYKTLQEKGTPVLRGERVELSEATVALLRDVGYQRSIRQFASYVEKNGIKVEDHGEVHSELTRLYLKITPDSDTINKDNYVEFFGELAEARIDFVTMATYFQENLDERYRITGRPDVGRFEQDLANFVKTTVTITERAKRLEELEKKWNVLTTGEDDSKRITGS